MDTGLINLDKCRKEFDFRAKNQSRYGNKRHIQFKIHNIEIEKSKIYGTSGWMLKGRLKNNEMVYLRIRTSPRLWIGGVFDSKFEGHGILLKELPSHNNLWIQGIDSPGIFNNNHTHLIVELDHIFLDNRPVCPKKEEEEND